MIGDYSDEGLKMIDLKLFNKELQICLGQKKNTLTKKIMVNGRTFLTLNGNVLVRPPSLEATPNRTSGQNTVFLDLFTMEILQIWSEGSFNPCVTSLDHSLPFI